MLQFIKNLFGFGKKETVAKTIENTTTDVTFNETPHIEYKKDIWLVSDESSKPEIETIPVNGRTKEELEQVVLDRISEIKKTDVAAPAVDKTPKPKAPKAAPKKTETKTEVKPKKTTAKPKAAPKKATKKGEK